MGLVQSCLQVLQNPTVGNMAAFAAAVWVALLAGLLLGWAWRPRWVAEVAQKPPHLTLPAFLKGPAKAAKEEVEDSEPESELGEGSGKLPVGAEDLDYLCRIVEERDGGKPPTEDLDYLCRIVEERDGGKPWIHMMDRSLPGMNYQAWRRDPENHPPQYRSRTVYEDVAPELVRDFFWDDEFRIKNGWDDMLLYHETLEECPTTGFMLVHWIRKFPFFCSDREYTIGRRIWDLGGAYYCVTKGVPCSSVPRKNKPKRVDLYYSSWCIRAVESSKGDGQMTACEVLLFHHEDMGIPWEIAKLGIRQGMWGCVKKIEPGLRAYQTARRAGEPLSRSALMAQVTTKIDVDYLRSVETSKGTLTTSEEAEEQKQWGLCKFVLLGGAVALACTLDHGLVTKAVIFGVARRFAKLGRRL